MTDPRGDILQITFYFENKVESLVGHDAKRWLAMVNSMCQALHNIGQIRNPFQNAMFEWIDETNKS